MDELDVAEIAHVYTYINVGLHGNHFNTICFVKKMQESNCQPIIFVSWDHVTPEHGQWTLTGDGTELVIKFNAREDPHPPPKKKTKKRIILRCGRSASCAIPMPQHLCGKAMTGQATASSSSTSLA